MSLVSFIEKGLASISLVDDEKKAAPSQFVSSEKEVPLVSTFLDSILKAVKVETNEQNLLKNVSFVFRVQADALQCILGSDLEPFDALVMDTACETRALLVVLIKRVLQVDAVLKVQESIKSKRAEISVLLSKTNGKSAIKAQALNEYMLKNKLEMLLPERLVLLAQAFFLTRVKVLSYAPQTCLDCGKEVEGVREKTVGKAYKTFYQDGPISVDTAEKLAYRAQVLLSQASTQLMMDEARFSLDAGVRSMLVPENVLTIKKTDVKQLPCYYIVKGVYDRCLALDIPILVNVKRAEHTVERLDNPLLCSIFLRSTGKDFVPDNPTEEELNAPLVVVDGQVMGAEKEAPEEYLKRFSKVGFMKIAELDGSFHYQYKDAPELAEIPLMMKALKSPDEGVSPYVLAELQRLKKLKAEAEVLGCCLKVQKLFVVKHVYADTLTSQIKKGAKLIKAAS